MSDKVKKIVFGLVIIIPFLAYSIYYYGMVFKNAPYKFTEFKSFVFKYGVKDSMVNSYDSATGMYQYLDKRDSLVKKQLYLSKDELLYLHHKASQVGFWNFPDKELNYDTAKLPAVKPLHYLIQFNYLHKSKTATYETDYNGPDKLVEANKVMIKEIKKTLAEAEGRQKK